VHDAGTRWVFPELLAEDLAPWDGVTQVWAAGSPDARHGVNITATFARGVASLRAHEAYLRGLGAGTFDAEAYLAKLGRARSQPEYLQRDGLALAVARPQQIVEVLTTIDHPAQTKFQFSIRYQLIDRFNLYLGYTQKSFWDAWDFESSSPFKETNYNPEAFYDFFDRSHWNGLALSAGVEHESNGRDGSASRGWNKAYLEPKLGSNESWITVRPKVWIPFSVDRMNPDTREYRRYAEMEVRFQLSKHPEILSLLVELKKGANSDWKKSGMQLGFVIKPLELLGLTHIPLLNGSYYFQYFNGYGESLENYNQSIRGFRMGFILLWSGSAYQ